MAVTGDSGLASGTAGNAFVVLGLLPAARAEEILAAHRPVLEAADFRVGLAIGELSVQPPGRTSISPAAKVMTSA